MDSICAFRKASIVVMNEIRSFSERPLPLSTEEKLWNDSLAPVA